MKVLRATLLRISKKDHPIRVCIEFGAQTLAHAINRYLVSENVRYLARNPVIDIFDAGAAYERDRDELWLPIPLAARAKHIDCEDAAAWVAATDIARGINSKVVVYSTGKKLMHAVVARPKTAPLDRVDDFLKFTTTNYRIIDPARSIGMGGY